MRSRTATVSVIKFTFGFASKKFFSFDGAREPTMNVRKKQIVCRNEYQGGTYLGSKHFLTVIRTYVEKALWLRNPDGYVGLDMDISW